jgi:riboflavin biosynthesis pyrimidine reductase
VDRLWPPDPAPAPIADDAELARLYDYPADLDRPWVKVNFISSVDGAVSVGGRSGGLSDANDKRVFRLGRALADVVLVGARTALIERYRGITADELPADVRKSRGLAEVPPIAVVSGTCSVEPTSALFTAAAVPTMLFTAESAPAARRAALADAGAEVIVAGDRLVDPEAVLAELDRRGLRRVDCEGGPTLFGTLVARHLVDELCLSVAPVLAGGDAARIAIGPLPGEPVRLALASVLHAENQLLLRYQRV